MANPKARSRLNPAFVAAVADSRIPNRVLAQRAGFPQPQLLSSTIHAQLVLPSPTTVARLQIVATLIGFTGPVFREEYPPVSTDAFTMANLPVPQR